MSLDDQLTELEALAVRMRAALHRHHQPACRLCVELYADYQAYCDHFPSPTRGLLTDGAKAARRSRSA